MTLIYILLFLCFTCSFGLLFALLKIRKQLLEQNDNLAQSSQQQAGLQKQIKQLQEAIHEIRTGTLGMGTRVKELVTELDQLKAKQEELVDQDPVSRLYGKAAKLVAQGASVDELMQECDLPRAEAELLFSVHKGGGS
jgi:septal ring factor EnvC (AmiA/AmiB activator)